MQVYFSRYDSAHVREKLDDFHLLFAGLLLYSVSIRQVLRPTGRPSQHRLVFLVFRYVQANVEVAAKIPSCHCMLLVQPSMLRFIKINLLAVK